MKKLALVVVNLDVLTVSENIKGGGSHVLKNLLKQWVIDDNVQVDVICTNSTLDAYDGINKIIKIPHCQMGAIFQFVKELKKIQQVEQYDNILFGDFISPYASVLLQSHSFAYRYDLYNWFLRAVFKYLKKEKLLNQELLFSRENEVYIAVSDRIKRDYAQHFHIPEEKIFVAYPGVDMPTLEPAYKNNDTLTYGIVGGSSLNKGLPLFLHSFSKLVKQKHKVKAIVICNNYEKLYYIKFLVKVLKLEKYLEILDFQSDMGEFYKKIDYLVMPSRHEAFGLVALEAASFGVVPIVSANTGFCEIITEGVNAFSFNINKSPKKNLHKVLLQTAKLFYEERDSYNIMVNNSWHLANLYTWKTFADKITENM